MFIVNVILKLFASGSYAIIHIYANELFPTQIRNTSIGICSMIARLGAITRVWLRFPIVVFGITSIIAVTFATICPETFDKPLPETVDDVERMGLTLPCGRSKPIVRVEVENDDDMDEKISLKLQSKKSVV